MKVPFVRFLLSRGEISEEMADQIGRWPLRHREPIGMIAVDHGLIIGQQIDEILDRQRESKLKFGELAVEMGFLTPDKVRTLLHIQHSRMLTGTVEALALAGVVPLMTGVHLLSDFVTEQPGDSFVEPTPVEVR